MTVACLAIAAMGLIVAIVAFRSSRANGRSLAAIATAQQERTLKLEQAVRDVTARCATLQQQATQGEDETRLRFADVEAHVVHEITTMQNTTQAAIAAEKASRQRLTTDVTDLRETVGAEFAAVRAEAQAERSSLAQQLNAGLAQVQDALITEVAVQVAALGEAVELHQD